MALFSENVDVVIHIANIGMIGTALWAIVKIMVPTGLAIRDSIRDTVRELATLQKTIADHEDRLRHIEFGEFGGVDRRKPREARAVD